MRTVILSLIFLFGNLCGVFAETIYLKNGEAVEGVIKKETPDFIDLEVGFGTVRFEKSLIEQIRSSSPEEAAKMMDKWEKQKEKAGLVRTRAEEERNRSLARWQEKRKAAEEAKIRDEAPAKDAELSEESGHMIVDAVLNADSHAELLVDTGASLVVLTKEAAQRAGINLDSPEPDVDLQIAGGRKLKARQVVIKSLGVGDAVVENVEAAVLTDDNESTLFKDGLLGMSFLRNFNFKFDYESGKLILEGRKKEE